MERGDHFVADRPKEKWVSVPTFDVGHVRGKPVFGKSLAQFPEVRANAQTRVMRRHAECDDLSGAIDGDLCHRLANERMPVPHADVNAPSCERRGRVQAILQRSCLSAGDVEERRSSADERVTAAHLGDKRGWRRSPRANVQQICLHVVERVRTSVGHHDDRAGIIGCDVSNLLASADSRSDRLFRLALAPQNPGNSDKPYVVRPERDLKSGSSRLNNS